MKNHRSARYVAYVEVDDIEEVQPEFDLVGGQPGLVYVCPVCGITWARVHLYYITHGTDLPVKSSYIPVTHNCRDHKGGSFLDKWVHVISPFDKDNFFGPQVTAREMQIAVKRYENDKRLHG